MLLGPIIMDTAMALQAANKSGPDLRSDPLLPQAASPEMLLFAYLVWHVRQTLLALFETRSRT